MRTFIAIDLPDAIKQRVADQQRRLELRLLELQLAGCVRWTAPTNLHLTLRFLGESNAQQVAQMQATLASVAPACAPIPLALGGLGCFPNFRRPNIVWLDFGGDLASLKTLQLACERGARAAGFAPEERPFTPHLTIGRMQRAVAGAELQRCGELLRRLADTAAHGSAAPHRFTADRVILMESDLRPSGSVYSELGAWSLGPTGVSGGETG